MAENLKSIIKNLSLSIVANGMSMLVSMSIVLIVPKVLEIEDYGYWQLYTFYVSYVGFFHLGWADGIYLRFAGKRYEDLDKQYFATQFWLLVFFEIFIALVITTFAKVFVTDNNKQFILTMVGFCCIVQIPRTLLQYLLQVTNRIGDYAKNYMLEKFVYVLLVVGVLVGGAKSFKILLFVDIFAKSITLILLAYSCKDIACSRMSSINGGITEAFKNISIGCKLMFANIAGLMLTGIVRLAIENKWDIATFGKVSLTLAISNMLMIFVGAVSVVIYPLLKNTPEDRLPELYKNLRAGLLIPLFGLLIFYNPLKYLLSMWLPQYAESLRYMALLLPICVFESKIAVLMNTYLQALRQEKVILLVNWCAVIITMITTAFTVYVFENLELAIASLLLMVEIRSAIGEIILMRRLKISLWKNLGEDFILSLLFVIFNWYLVSWHGTTMYITAYICYLWFNRKYFNRLYSLWKDKEWVRTR